MKTKVLMVLNNANDAPRTSAHPTALIRLTGLILWALFSDASQARNQYIKQLDSNVQINWKEGICEQDLLVDKNTKRKIDYQCKIKYKNNEVDATWLKDSKGKLLYLPSFFPFKLLFTDAGYGLILHSDSYLLNLFLEIDKNGAFQESHIAEGEILLNDENSGLRYLGTLVWRSSPLDNNYNKCASDFEVKLGFKPKSLGSLYLHVPSLINIQTLPVVHLG